MVELSPTTAFMIYLGLTLTVLLGIWLSQHFRGRKRKLMIAEQELFVCEYCHFCYLEMKGRPVTQCPQCESFNKNNYFKR